MKGKTPLLFLMIITVLVAGAFAIYNSLRALPTSVPDLANAAMQASGDDMKLTSKADAANYPLAPRIESETWLNSQQLNWDELRGKVVLVEFWTFG